MLSCYSLKRADDPAARRHSGRIVLVTGAAGGIGGAVAVAAAREGATVLLLDKNQKGLDAIYDHVTSERLPEPVEIAEDLSTLDVERASSLARQLAATFDRLDAIIHAACESAPLSPLEHFPVDIWQRVLHAQITAPWILVRTLLPLLRRSNHPRVVFSSGSAGRTPRAYFGATAIGWSAVDTLAALFAEEFEQNETARFFALDPGEVHTATRTRWYPGQPPEGLADPEQVADAYVYLASPESAAFQGTTCTLRGVTLEGRAQAR